jgi:hypothetical protein
MKRLVLSGLALLVTFILLSGCDSLRIVRGTGDIAAENREVSGFSAVDLAGVGTVIVDFGDKEALRIEAENNLLPYLESNVEDEILILSVREEVNILPTQAIFYYLTVRDLEEITVSGLGNIDLPRVEGTQLTINVSGGGDINVEELHAKDLDVEISGLGDLSINSGEVAASDILINGGGNYNARKLASEVVDVTITGLGSARVWARDTLSATISGGGSVRYDGHPQVAKEITGLGEVLPAGGE